MKKQENKRASAHERELDLFLLAEYGSVEEMDELLSEGVNLDVQEPAYQRSPLMVAAACNTSDVVDALLGKVEDVKLELRLTAPGGLNALHWAAMSNGGTKGAAVVQTLLSHHADVSVQTKNGDTALDLAVRFKNKDTAELLASE